MKYHILVVEDQHDISHIVSKYLEKEGYEWHVSKDGFEALDYFNHHTIHLVLLDIMMPGINGYEVLQEIRRISEVPVIMLTAKQEEIDRLRGFDIGADDYVVKPFSVRELMKRVKVLLKRVYHDFDEIVYSYKNITLHTKGMRLYKNNHEISITASEYGMLLAFFMNQGQVLTREQLIYQAFGNEYEGYDRNIDTYIKRLRQKIEDNPRTPKILRTKYGAGYIFGGDAS